MTAKFRDYYSTLGVDRTADATEIRKAYRRLARKFHPDVNPGDKEAEEKFKDLQEAYAVLSDPEKRRKYDQLGANWNSGADFTPPPGWTSSADFRDFEEVFGEAGAGGFSDFFQSLFGGSFDPARRRTQRSSTARGEDVESELELTLDDIMDGATRPIVLRSSEPCPDCGGRGTKFMGPCESCRGTGQVVTRRRLTVNIPPGVRNGTTLRIPGKGNRRGPNSPPGDLYLKIRIRPHPPYEFVEDGELQMEVPITPWEAALGSHIQISTLNGSIEAAIPHGTQNGTRLRLKEKGLRKRDGSKGDLYLKVKVVVPDQLSAEEEELFRRLGQVSRFKPRNR